MDQPQTACPRCGYCPHCGRSNVPSGQWVQPVYPYVQPWWQTQPFTTAQPNTSMQPNQTVQHINATLELVS